MSNNTVKKNFGGKFKVISRTNTNYIVSSYDDIKDDYATIAADYPTYKEIYITKVIYKDPATIVFWNDGTKTVAKCHGTDVYSPETGIMICCFKKLVGATNLKNLFTDWAPSTSEIIHDFNGHMTSIVNTLSDVRKKYKGYKA